MDLCLDGRQVIVVGGGSEGLKRISHLLMQGCEIILYSNTTNKEIDEYIRARRIKFKKAMLRDAEFLSDYNPHIVMATTNDADLNRKIVQKAKTMKCLAYASNDPEASDFAHVSVINIKDAVQVAISTGGKSPAMAGKLKDRVQEALEMVVSDEDVLQIKMQKIAREKARKIIGTQQQRRRFLYTVINDDTIEQFIKNHDIQGAQNRMEHMLEKWDEK